MFPFSIFLGTWPRNGLIYVHSKISGITACSNLENTQVWNVKLRNKRLKHLVVFHTFWNKKLSNWNRQIGEHWQNHRDLPVFLSKVFLWTQSNYMHVLQNWDLLELLFLLVIYCTFINQIFKTYYLVITSDSMKTLFSNY